ncbi:hypothetical protein M406DRAFT_355468 [Cryphonectria parasitica EP155]|uniref:Uncharacterized protein n=1 Tax=Cryphonectria parasitica (strain ATCC 38755 / EP155) TaxID=660469 RepID=A0A9P5CR29_CRYP1|nr:uncharacterized protein M406DRAFT_355468 [Cryphonectria parasitica EP155]KAF3767102.1 hypothetical protein M406DRAFT_355468 [Cryphonectria parasitica EP155]
MAATPLFLSPALPSELLAWVTRNESYPTTLIICSSRAEFLSSLIQDVRSADTSTGTDDPETSDLQHLLLSSPLYQVAVARHIRLIFTPTVSHLRACLSVFDPADSKAPPPPPAASVYSVPPSRAAQRLPLLLVYGFLRQHRDTSEWSAQGINATAAVLVEAGRRCGFRALLVDAPTEMAGDGPETEEGDMHEGAGAGSGQSVLDEEVPVLSPSTVRAGGDRDDAVWTGRKVALGRVLGRWFRYREGDWKRQGAAGTLDDPHEDEKQKQASTSDI